MRVKAEKKKQFPESQAPRTFLISKYMRNLNPETQIAALIDINKKLKFVVKKNT